MYRQGLMAAGDYRQGGYANRGDGLFSFIGSGLKAISGILPGPLGGVAKAVGGVLAPKPHQSPIGATLPPPPKFTGVNVGGPSGFTIGTGTVPGTYAPVAGKIPGKKRKRMNVTNVKALRRAGRRVKGFEKLARRFIGFASPRRPKGRMYFRSKKRAA